jgi:hypothetical protein
MKIDKLLEQYDKEWLLIKVNEWDKNWDPVDGEVIFHSSVGEKVRKEVLKLKGKKFDLAILYAGEFEFPEDVAILV